MISICIPAYKNATYLKRLLESICIQKFTDFEVIVSDDSNNGEVKELTDQYANQFALNYVNNQPALGSPANWNNAIKLAKGEWIKMMHDDDWFADEYALKKFAEAAATHKADFIFSGFCEINSNGTKQDCYCIGNLEKKMLNTSPYYLFKKNFIGHPSTTLIKKDNELLYDENLKWVVDIEYYMRYLLKHQNFLAIEQPLINIGINEFQITKVSFRNPEVEIPENLYLYRQLPKGFLRNIYAYDYYWRLIRNLNIRKMEALQKYSKKELIPKVIEKMIHAQSKIKVNYLKNGFINKGLMMASYLNNYKYL